MHLQHLSASTKWVKQSFVALLFGSSTNFAETGSIEFHLSPIAILVLHTDLFTANAVHFVASAVRREQIRLSAFISLNGMNNGNGLWGMDNGDSCSTKTLKNPFFYVHRNRSAFVHVSTDAGHPCLPARTVFARLNLERRLSPWSSRLEKARGCSCRIRASLCFIRSGVDANVHFDRQRRYFSVPNEKSDGV